MLRPNGAMDVTWVPLGVCLCHLALLQPDGETEPGVVVSSQVVLFAVYDDCLWQEMLVMRSSVEVFAQFNTVALYCFDAFGPNKLGAVCRLVGYSPKGVVDVTFEIVGEVVSA